jgi:pimeloyl-ACP methyl ester carboxylesterase
MKKLRPKQKKIVILLILIPAIWLLLAQSVLKLRTEDHAARRAFGQHGVSLFTHTYQVEGYTMHYVQTGQDSLPTLLFIHGSPGSWNAFTRYMQDKELLGKFRMISIDRPGFGFSSFGKARNLEEQSRLIGPALQKIKNGKPIYAVGHSMGGPLAIRLDMDHPGIFSGLVLLAASVSPYLENAEIWRPLLFRTPLNYWVPGAMRPANEELWYLKSDLKKMEPGLVKITSPVWIVHGDKDPLVPVRNVDFIKSKLIHAQNMTVTILPGANHFIPWQHFTEIKAVLLSLPVAGN